MKIAVAIILLGIALFAYVKLMALFKMAFLVFLPFVAVYGGYLYLTRRGAKS